MDIPGFLSAPKTNPQGETYRGRLALPGIQWTGTGEDRFATFTVTADQVADAAENRMLWTDQSVQRGINPASPAGTPRELAVSEGYPGPEYIFDNSNADDMADKLLRGSRLFFSPLVWNLRPGTFKAFWSGPESSIFIYDGHIYLPDSHHRHQALLKAVRAYREHPKGYPKFKPARQFKVELYFLTREDEGEYFFDKNQRPKSTAMSKAYDLTTQDDLSLLAKRFIDRTPSLENGVNRVTDRLSKKAPYFVTLSTLREMMKTYAGTDELEEAEFDGLVTVASEFFELLANVRPELHANMASQFPDSLAAAGVMMHAYAALMRDFGTDVGHLGLAESKEQWRTRLACLSPATTFTAGGWDGDIFDKHNPLWATAAVTKLAGDSVGIQNTGGARSRAARALRMILGLESADLSGVMEALGVK